jgi:hypothetical protein
MLDIVGMEVFVHKILRIHIHIEVGEVVIMELKPEVQVV